MPLLGRFKITGSVTGFDGEYIKSNLPKVCGSAFSRVTISWRDTPRAAGQHLSVECLSRFIGIQERILKKPSDLPGVTAALKCDIATASGK